MNTFALFLIVYAIWFVVAWAIAAYVCMVMFKPSARDLALGIVYPCKADYVASVVVGALAASVWPVSIVGCLVAFVVKLFVDPRPSRC